MINIHFKDTNVEFLHQLEHKYLFVVGDSATGKSTFVELVRLAASESALCLEDSNVYAVTGAEPEISILTTSGNVYVIDEEAPFWKRPDYCQILMKSDNHFILMFRDLPAFSNSLPMGLDDICEIWQEGSLYKFCPITKGHIRYHNGKR